MFWIVDSILMRKTRQLVMGHDSSVHYHKGAGSTRYDKLQSEEVDSSSDGDTATAGGTVNTAHSDTDR